MHLIRRVRLRVNEEREKGAGVIDWQWHVGLSTSDSFSIPFESMQRHHYMIDWHRTLINATDNNERMRCIPIVQASVHSTEALL